MREILFKAKRKDNGEWVEGSLIIAEGSVAYIIRSKSKAFIPKGESIICSAECYEINPETLCQYTGLTDKNGRKIWENDILKANLDESHPEDITYIKILWNECRFCVNENYSTDIDALEKWDAEHFQVCGNIFDNAELLEVE